MTGIMCDVSIDNSWGGKKSSHMTGVTGMCDVSIDNSWGREKNQVIWQELCVM